ncbi:MAG: outer membrane protein assembly factor BamE [Gammaproteobacteria bacterium]|nr:outer membrane protein assembly factor BamE [Gammaproteobacteria bacterium]
MAVSGGVGSTTQPGPGRFPSPESASRPEGTFPDRKALRSIGLGMTKDQVRSLLGSPHFDEGFFGVREWNYIFHFRTQDASNLLTCQYMVRFDEQMRTIGSYWKASACEDKSGVSTPKIVVRPLTPPIVALLKPQSIRFDTDQLFGEPGARHTELLPRAVRQFELLASEILRNFGKTAEVSVVARAHGANRGDEQQTQTELRTIRDLLIRLGIDESRIRVAVAKSGTSARACAAQDARANAECNLPERSVEIVVAGGRGS